MKSNLSTKEFNLSNGMFKTQCDIDFVFTAKKKIKDFHVCTEFLTYFNFSRCSSWAFLVSNWEKKILFIFRNGALFRPQIKRKRNTEWCKALGGILHPMFSKMNKSISKEVKITYIHTKLLHVYIAR